MESFGECLAVTIKEHTRFVRRIDERQRSHEPIAPGANDGRDFVFERRAFYCGSWATGAADDEMDADERSLIREKRIES